MKSIVNRLMGLVLLVLSSTICAKEGSDQYPYGAETMMAGALPPPGSYFLNYAGYYAGTLQDAEGNDISPIKVDAWFDALRYVYVSDIEILGGNYVVHGILPLVQQNISAFGDNNRVASIGDITINPFAIAWHWPQIHMVAGLDINLPTGRYDADQPLQNIGANYITFEPLFGITYATTKGWDLSAKLMYSLSGENKDTNYDSGDEFHLDFGINKRFDAWTIGLGGYYIKQLEDDVQQGIVLSQSRGQALAFGPQVRYERQGTQFIFKWFNESNVRNRFGGNRIFFKFIKKI